MAAHTYWRIYILNSNGISQPTPKGNWTEIEEVEMRGAVGGADQCNGGTITASNEWAPTYTAARAFDNGATSYYWATNLWSNNGIATWLKYQFP